MSRPASEHPTELELKILQILWSCGPQPVREIRDTLAEGGRDIAHTSVITTLNTMFDKGYVKRKKVGKAFHFSAKLKKDQVSNRMLGDLVDRVFDGSASAVMLSLFGQGKIESSELRDLKRLINQRLREDDK